MFCEILYLIICRLNIKLSKTILTKLDLVFLLDVYFASDWHKFVFHRGGSETYPTDTLVLLSPNLSKMTNDLTYNSYDLQQSRCNTVNCNLEGERIWGLMASVSKI